MSFIALPGELLHLLWKYLTPYELLKLQLTCHQLYTLIESQEIWKRKIEEAGFELPAVGADSSATVTGVSEEDGVLVLRSTTAHISTDSDSNNTNTTDEEMRLGFSMIHRRIPHRTYNPTNSTTYNPTNSTGTTTNTFSKNNSTNNNSSSSNNGNNNSNDIEVTKLSYKKFFFLYAQKVVGMWDTRRRILHDTQVEDLSVLKNHGIVIGNPQIASSGCMKFGNEDYIEVPHSNEYNHSDSMTVEVWCRMKKSEQASWYPYQNSIVSNHGAGTGWELRGGKQCGYEWVITPTTKPGTAFYHNELHCQRRAEEDGNWVHLAGVVKDSRSQFFVDGTLVAEKSLDLSYQNPKDPSTHWNDYTGNLGIARNTYWTDRLFHGEIATVRITKTALPSALFLPHP